MKFVDYGIADLVKKINNGYKIICFGAGKGFTSFYCQMRPFCIQAAIDFVVDNDPSQWEKEICMSDRTFIIVSASLIRELKHIGEKYILVITCQALANIKEQVNSYPELDNIEVCYYRNFIEEYMLNKALNVQLPKTFRVTDKRIIPKVIHYCWFGKKPLPVKYKQWIKSWGKYCPEYEILEWNEHNYDINKNTYMSDAYKAGKWGFVSDYARLDIIYEHGGIYLDTDVEVVQNLDELLYEDGFCGLQPDNRVNTGLGFGAINHFPIIGEMRDDYQRLTFIDYHTEKEARQVKLCPDIQTSFLEKKGFIKNGDFQDIEGLRIYPAPVLCGMIGKTIIKNNKTFTIHHFDGSWVPI